MILYGYILPVVLLVLLFGLIVWNDRSKKGRAGITVRDFLIGVLLVVTPVLNIVVCLALIYFIFDQHQEFEFLNKELF